ncbi:hypothetical protein N431DRAFT_485094 [Stipitochalara longipes BDJ]|nr:hypothetical protein N431DRAFT_485094 [Stipitochalara longipes BDJ]
MNFGFSLGDFVGVGQLAWQIYRKCKSASSEFKSISSQLISLHIVFKDVNETIEELGLPESKKGDLLQIAENSKETLDELDQLLKKYSGLGMKSSRTLDRLRYPRAHVDDLRSRLDSYINMLSSFKMSLVLSSQARLEKMVTQIMTERQEGLREASVISRESLAAVEDGDEDIWLDIKRELEDYGTITDEILNEHRNFIIDLLKSALSSDDDNQPVCGDLVSEVEQCESKSQVSIHNDSEIAAAVRILSLTEDKSQSELRSIQGSDDDIGEYLMDDLYDALSFYEIFCQDTSTGKLQKSFGLKLYLLGRSIKVLQRLTSANPEFWHLALSNTIEIAEDVFAMTEPVVEHWFSAKINEGLWESGTTRLSRIETSSSKEIAESEDYFAEKDVLVIKDNLQVVRTAMQVNDSPIPLQRVMQQQIAACQLSLLVLQCGALWSYAHLKHRPTSSSNTQAKIHNLDEKNLRTRSNMLIMRSKLLQALATYLSRPNTVPHLLKLAFMTAWRNLKNPVAEYKWMLKNGLLDLCVQPPTKRYADVLELLHLEYHDQHFKLGPQMIPSGRPLVISRKDGKILWGILMCLTWGSFNNSPGFLNSSIVQRRVSNAVTHSVCYGPTKTWNALVKVEVILFSLHRNGQQSEYSRLSIFFAKEVDAINAYIEFRYSSPE